MPSDMIFITCGLVILVWLLIFLHGKKAIHKRIPPGARLPPMPKANSLWGHVELLAYGFHRREALKWANDHGPVFRLKVNFYNIVIPNSIEAIKKFLNTKELLNRSHCFLTAREYYAGVGSLSGIPWMATRKFCLNMLRNEEIRRLSEKIANTNGEPIQVHEFLMSAVLNNVASFFYGSWAPDHPNRLKLLRIIKKLSEVFNTGPLFQFIPPAVRRLHSRLSFTRNGLLNTAMMELEEFSKTQIENNINCNHQDGTADFIQRYMEKIEQEKSDPDAMFTYRRLVGTINGFLIGGTFTTTAAMQMHMVNFASNQNNIQDRVQKEIDEVIGQERWPTWEDRKSMPFTMACVWEMDRWSTTSVLGAARECSEDVVIDGFFIPRGTVVLPNIWAVHNDPVLWKEPQKFNPGRFLNEDGSILAHKPEYLIPFSTGRRCCPAETFASMEIFLMVTYLLQNFRVLPCESINSELDFYNMLPHQIRQIKLRFVPRRHTEA
ncbi:cytochrome P450 2F3-like isoform X2 [Haemaphysalis longicornis]